MFRWREVVDDDGTVEFPRGARPRLHGGPNPPTSTAEFRRTEGPAAPDWSPERWTEDFTENALYQRWRRRVAEGDPNDFILAISASPASTGVTGTGKTTLALRLAKQYFDISDSGFDAETQATLKATEIDTMYRENEPGSTLIFDEGQGVSAGSGVNARRSMSNSSLDAIGSVAANRMRAMTLVIVSQNIKWLDKNLLDLVDAWVRITREPTQPDGPEATAYELFSSDMEFETRKTKTPVITDLTWSDVPDSDPDYRELERMKAEATRHGEAADEGEPELPTEVRDEKIKKLVEAGAPQAVIGEAFGVSQSRVSQIANGSG